MQDGVAKYLVPLGRTLYALIFIVAVPGHFEKSTFYHASVAGVPLPSITVPLSGLVALAGGLSVLVGYKARWGAWLLVLFLVPVTIMMHAFWAAPSGQEAQAQMTHFLKNVAMIGAAILIAHFGAGPMSFDARAKP
jgi:putative oxidoreductase